jgi:hypothetical protein
MAHVWEKTSLPRGPPALTWRLPLRVAKREDVRPTQQWQRHIKSLGIQAIVALLSVEAKHVLRLRWRNHRDRIIKRLCSGRVFVLALEVHVGHRGAKTIDLSIKVHLHENTPHVVL